MPPFPYHGGHAFDDILQVWLSRLSLPQAQECLARLIATENIQIAPPFRDGWWLKRDGSNYRVENDDGSDRAERFRCHLSDPRLMDPLFLFNFLEGLAPVEKPPMIVEDDDDSPRIKRLEAARARYEAEALAAADSPPQPQEPTEVTPEPQPETEPSPPDPGPPKAHSRRGRREYDVWDPMFDHLDALVKERGKPFETYTEAADYGLEFIKQLAEARRKEGKGAALPEPKSIQEKISDRRPDLVIG